MSKPVVGAAAAAFVVMVAVIAFLLGRESNRHARQVADTAPVGAETAPVGAAPGTPAPANTTPPTPPESSGVTTAAPSTTPPATQPPPSRIDPLPPAPPPSPTQTAPTRSANASAIRDYFIRIDSIQAGGITGDSQEVAGKLLTSAMRGDSSGLDDIVKTVDASVAKVKAITPPPECAGYHTKMLELLVQSQQLVRSLKTAMTSQDPSALASIATTGDALKTKAEALEADGKAIRARAGL